MDHATRREPLCEVAAAWHDRVHRENVPHEIRAALALWLAESPEHRAAYEEIERTWADLRSAAHAPQILALRHEAALRLTRRTSRRIRPLTWVAAAVILVALGTSLATLGTRLTSARSPVAILLDVWRTHGDGRYATTTGERLNVTLPDGSQLTLNTQTELKVAFTRAERTVHLIRGQALFEVAKDPTRPFVVMAYSRRFIAVGTAFDVRLDGSQIHVTMVEGTVRVERTAKLNVTENAPPRAMPGVAVSAQSGTVHTELDTLANAPPAVTTITA